MRKNAMESQAMISSLPLSAQDREEFMRAAARAFDKVLERIEPQNPELTRALWDAGSYIDQLLSPEMLPISRDYALSLVDAFLVHDVIPIAIEADQFDRDINC